MKEFSLIGFAVHLGRLAIEQAEAEHIGLEAAAIVVEREAKAEIGHYQNGSGPFGPWPELADRTKDDRVRAGFSENEPGQRSGEMRDDIGHTVGERGAAVGSDDDKLVYFELGTERQPPRSVLGIAASNKAGEVVDILGGYVVQSLIGEGVHNGRMPI